MVELIERTLRMFITTIGGAPMVSRSDLAMSAVTAALIVNVSKAIEELMGTSKKPGTHRAEMVRCCGELYKEEARGWQVADAVGRPLLHRNDDCRTKLATLASACSSSAERQRKRSRRRRRRRRRQCAPQSVPSPRTRASSSSRGRRRERRRAY